MTPQEFDAWLKDDARRPLVMGVLNVTPDSFSDGGRFASPQAALEQAHVMSAAGADIIDVGGESTRPGSEPVPPDEQIRRVIPVIEGARDLPVVLSIDTTQAEVAEAALAAGATIVNDISAGRDDPKLLRLVARRRAPLILMHMLGRPKTMQQAPHYDDVVGEVMGFLNEQIVVAGTAAVDLERILIDPGIGFGKTATHNLQLLRRLPELTTLGRPIVIGTSRKRFIGEITGETDPSQRIFGTAATVAWSIAAGASIVRVHDVGPIVQVVRMVNAIREAPGVE